MTWYATQLSATGGTGGGGRGGGGSVGEMEEAWAAREQEDSARRLGLLRTGQGRQLDLRHLGR